MDTSRPEMDRVEKTLSPSWYADKEPSQYAKDIASDPNAFNLLLALAASIDVDTLLSLTRR